MTTNAVEIRWSPSADRDIERIRTYLHDRSPRAARRLMRQFVDAADRLQQHPEIGEVAAELIPEGAYRKVIVRPYLIIYRPKADRLEIVRVWDSRRDPASLTIPTWEE